MKWDGSFITLVRVILEVHSLAGISALGDLVDDTLGPPVLMLVQGGFLLEVLEGLLLLLLALLLLLLLLLLALSMVVVVAWL